MDDVQDYAEYRALIRGLGQIDRLVLAHRPTFHFLSRVVAALPRHAPALHIVDVGCGDGDLLRRVARWARRRQRAATLTGVDLNPNAIRAARELSNASATDSAIRWVQGDIAALTLDEPVDVVLSCHVTHHLSDPQLVSFLRWMETNARLGWLVNDLHREIVPYHVFAVLSRVLPIAPILRDDGLVSIRRAFQPADWHELCAKAGLSPAGYRVRTRYPARLCVEHLKAPVLSSSR
jgi:SAM-dependent methyltransferase